MYTRFKVVAGVVIKIPLFLTHKNSASQYYFGLLACSSRHTTQLIPSLLQHVTPVSQQWQNLFLLVFV